MITFDTNVLARYYIADKADGFAPQEVARVFHHLLGLPHVTVEDRETLSQALARCEAGLDMTDALHHASYRGCENVASFDDQKCARRVKRLGLRPRVAPT